MKMVFFKGKLWVRKLTERNQLKDINWEGAPVHKALKMVTPVTLSGNRSAIELLVYTALGLHNSLELYAWFSLIHLLSW